MLHDVVGFVARRHRRIRSRRAHAIYATGHVDHEKRVACMWFFPYSYGAWLSGPSGRQGFCTTLKDREKSREWSNIEKTQKAIMVCRIL